MIGRPEIWGSRLAMAVPRFSHESAHRPPRGAPQRRPASGPLRSRLLAGAIGFMLGISTAAAVMLAWPPPMSARGIAPAIAGHRTQPAASPAPRPSSASAPRAVGYWGMAPSADGGPSAFPRSDAYCAARVAHSQETIPDNATADATPGPGDSAVIQWGPAAKQMVAGLRYVDGHYTGTTADIFAWAACKWGWDENTLKAQAVAESSWHESNEGDAEDGCNHTFSIIGIRDSQGQACPTDHSAWGGYPYTYTSTAVALDFAAAYLRSCYDGHASGIYGQDFRQLAAANGWNYIEWQCIGTWYSGTWDSNDADYIASVQNHLAQRDWLEMH